MCEFQDNACKAIAKLGKMCTKTVQKEYFSVKASRKWTLKELWDYLKMLGKLQGIWHRDCKNIQKFMTNIRNEKSEIKDLKITVDEAITI